MVDSLSLRLVPDELWEIVQPLIPVFPPRPQGAWLTRLPPPHFRYERHAHLFAALLSLAAAITCFKKLAT